MPKAFVCSKCGKEAEGTPRTQAGATVKAVDVHKRCSGATIVLQDVKGEGAKKQEKIQAQIAAHQKVETRKSPGGPNEFKDTGTHHNPFKTGSKTGQQQHFSTGGNASRAQHSEKKDKK